MPVRTRSIAATEAATQNVVANPLQGTLCIVNRSSLENYTALLKHHPQASELLDELRVFFQKDSAFPLYLLRECLSLSSSITDLTLEIGNASPYPRTLFPSLCFPRLQFFKTSVPHSLLIDFMSTHSSLRVLVLGNCGRKKICPLGRGTVNLPEVADLQCPIGCGLLEAAPAVVCLKITHGSLPTPTSTCIAHIPKASSLTHLTVPLASTDFDVISKVFKFAPRVRKLHLVYYSGSQLRGPGNHCHPWSKYVAWAHQLKRLRHLEEVLLTSNCGLGDIGDECGEELVYRWLTGRRLLKKTWSNRAAYFHPTLYSLSFRYRLEGGGQEIYTSWSKSIPGARWSCDAHKVQSLLT